MMQSSQTIEHTPILKNALVLTFSDGHTERVDLSGPIAEQRNERAGQSCVVKFVDGVLFVHSESAVNVALHTNQNPDAIYIETKGKVEVNTDPDSALNPKLGMYINAAEMNLNTDINTKGFVAFRCDNDNRSEITTRGRINAGNLTVIGKKFSSFNKISTGKLNLDATSLHLAGELELTSTPTDEALFTPLEADSDVKVLFKRTKQQLETHARSVVNVKKAVVLKDVYGDQLDFTAKSSFVLHAQMRCNDLEMHVPTLDLDEHGSIDCPGKLKVKAKRIHAKNLLKAKELNLDAYVVTSTGRGCIWAVENFAISSWLTFVGFLGSIRCAGPVISTGFFVNFLGGVIGYNFYTDNTISIDCGLTVPDIPKKRSDIINLQKIIIALRMAVLAINKPLGEFLKLIHKLYSLNKKSDVVYEQYAHHFEKESQEEKILSTKNVLLTSKAIFFATAAIYSAHSSLQRYYATPPGSPDLQFKWDAWEILSQLSIAVLPCYCNDSVLMFSAGLRLGPFASESMRSIDYSKSYSAELYNTLSANRPTWL